MSIGQSFDPFANFENSQIPSDRPKTELGRVSKGEEISPFTVKLQELQRRVPVVGDKALVDFVSGINVSGEIIRYRKRRNFFGRLMDTLSGSDRKRELLVQGNLLDGQEALRQWTLELSNTLNVSIVGLEVTQKSLEVTQKSLLEARKAVRYQGQKLNGLYQLVSSLSTDLNDRIDNLELRVSAGEDFENIVNAWKAERTYANFPWAVQVALLAREVFSSSVILNELSTGNTQFRQRLIDQIVIEAKVREIPQKNNGLEEFANRMWEIIKNDQDHELLVSLLETYSASLQQLMGIPHLFVIGKTLELSRLPLESRPGNPAACALALCQSQIGGVENIQTPRDFARVVVEETANNCSNLVNIPAKYRK